MAESVNWLKMVMDGELVIDIGQINSSQRLELNKAHRKGLLVKFKGFWYPDPYSPVGLGHQKTCYVRRDLYKGTYNNEKL